MGDLSLNQTVKKIVKLALRFCCFPISIVYVLLTRSRLFKFKTISILISIWPGELGITIRQIYYEKVLKRCGKNLRIHYGAFIVYDSVEIGNQCTIEEFSIISNCVVGDDVIIAARVSIMSGGHHHDIDDLSTKFIDSNLPLKKVIIGSNIWIGTHAVIMSDVSSGSVVGAGSVVTKSYPINTVIAGVPARLIRHRGI